jgi:hypothetical protein
MTGQEDSTFEQLQALAAEHDGEDMIVPPVEPPRSEEVEKPESDAKPNKPPPISENPPSSESTAKADEPPSEESSLKSGEGLSKSDKESGRQNKSWRRINSEKEAIRAEREELDSLRKKLNQASPQERYLDEQGLSAQDYEEAAESFTEDGEVDKAEAAQIRAAEVRSKAEKEFSDDVDDSFKESWRNNFIKSSREHPELDDESSEFYQQVQRLIIEKPVLATYSNGISDAVDIVSMRGKVQQSSSLQEQISALENENTGLKSKLSIGGSAPSDGPSADRDFKDLSKTDQFEALKQMAARADGA